MRMVIEMPDELHARLKKRAHDEDRPLAKIVRELIKEYLEKKKDG
jgi:predicted DNA-binding protein